MMFLFLYVCTFIGFCVYGVYASGYKFRYYQPRRSDVVSGGSPYLVGFGIGGARDLGDTGTGSGGLEADSGSIEELQDDEFYLYGGHR